MRRIWKTVVPMSEGTWTLFLVTTDEAVRRDLKSGTSRIRGYPYENLGRSGSHNPHRDLALGTFFAYLSARHSGRKFQVQEIDRLPEGLRLVSMGEEGSASLFLKD